MITILMGLTSTLLPNYHILQWQIFWLNHLTLIQAKKQTQIIAVFNFNNTTSNKTYSMLLTEKEKTLTNIQFN